MLFATQNKVIDAQTGLNAKIKGALVYENAESSYLYFKNLLDFAKNLEP